MNVINFLGDDAIDLFAGAGGWEEGAKPLGLRPMGIEADEAACATRKAAGHRTVQADVSKLDPLDFGPVKLVIASPPCPTFSSAGNGGGRLLTDLILRCLHELAAGNDTRAEHRQEAYEILAPIYRGREEAKAREKKREPDLAKAEKRSRRDADMSLLVVEPLRWALALKPRFVALEQVPEVLGLWSQMAQILSTLGYSTWTGVVEAERYGVPQTRERAILMADREGPVHPPRPTHQRYVKGEPQRHEHTLEGEVVPWVSMAEALGWTEGARPSPAPTVSGGGTGSGGGVEVFAGAHARKRVLEATQRNGSTGEYGERCEGEPAFTIAPNTDRWKIRMGNQDNATERDAEEPAPTVLFGHRANKTEWVHDRPAPTIVTTRRSKDGILVGRQLPAGERVTLDEAAILQSFRPDYPFQGTKSQRFLQVGNAVPPLLAEALLRALLAPYIVECERVLA